ncbi:Type III restriction enzyme, res subunit [Legionella steigerwaltii]|uniref:Type III restriction enzyme, res subunit n=1 Tax=Legionella steigerwaltii TaxID=460 RepID=A0A378LDH5_9GAMM|nr:DEAD/DEAH box helicase family protein [Legionella steigerwaltii]KTD71929.1 Type III restriction enzyme, res subunit [Legionella steigerwaltii]STY23922.1 Type III restriction enzyme, res subunit [Legionella steigerwaltii]
MGAKSEIVDNQIANLKDYADTVAAVHLLKEVVTNGAVVTVGSAKDIIAIENTKKDPKIANIVKAILAKAGSPGEPKSQWTKKEDEKLHLEAAITIGGAVYTVDFTYDGIKDSQQEYTVNITSKLSAEVNRGKLFFDHDHTATVKLTYDREGDLRAVTKNGLSISDDKKTFIPHAYQNEILAKFIDSLIAGKQQRLAVMGTGSGKSIVMAGIAQAVGRTVMIVPDKTLVDQQSSETQKMLGAGKVNGSTHIPTVFTLEAIKPNVDVDWSNLKEDLSDMEEDDKQKIKEYFAKVIAGTEPFDQIILQAEHPLFKIIASEIKDSMVLIDESHRHTFTEEDAQVLEGLKSRNSMLALTATPTSKLYALFPGDPLDDLSLGAAIQLGTIRPIKPEVAYLEEKDLIDQAVIHYFDDYYLEEGMNGYVDPVALKEQIKKGGVEDSVAQKQAIDQALELNRIRAQRNMGFSDDKATREKLADTYQKLANGDGPTLEKYQAKVAELRKESESKARVELAKKFGAVNELAVRGEVPLREVNLKNDIDKEQQKDIQRTINSFALALIFNEKFTDIAEKDRSHKLEEYLKDCDGHISKYKTKDGEIPAHILSRLQECDVTNRVKLNSALTQLGAPISKLPTAQKEAMVKLILDRAEAIAAKIKTSQPITDVVTKAAPVDLVALKATEGYASAIDMKTKQDVIDAQLAQIEVGLRTHIIADEVIATGVSIRDILNVQVINSNSPVIESNINAINGILSGPQATGRCVRNKDVEARAQQYIDKRYQDKGLILTVHDIIDPKDSAAKTREVMLNREQQAKKEAKVLHLLKTELKGFDAFTLFQRCVPLHDRIEGLIEKLDVAKNLLIDKEKTLDVQKDKVAKTSEKHESSKKSLLQEIDTLDKELYIVPGRKDKDGAIPLPSEYARNPSLYLTWVKATLKRATLASETKEVLEAIKALEVEIDKLEKDISELQVTIKEGSLELAKLKEEEERMIQKMEEVSKLELS